MTFRPHIFGAALTDCPDAATGFGGLPELVPSFLLIAVGGALSVTGTSSAEPGRLWEAPYIQEPEATTSWPGWAAQHTKAEDEWESTRQGISELRRISGLTWEQVGELFDVSRRSVHFWASGKPLNASNEQRLMQVLDVVRMADRGDARSTRAALLEVRNGTTAFALLSAKRFEEARNILNAGSPARRPALQELSATARAARRPLPPEELVDARRDRIHRDPGHARAARTVRNKRRGPP